MSAVLLDRPARPRDRDRLDEAPSPDTRLDLQVRPSNVVIYGDFNCPWSYLAFRRSRLLAAAGVEIDWRAVEHAPWRPGSLDDRSEQYDDLLGEMDVVSRRLLPSEPFPYQLRGIVPRTAAAIAAYAEGYAASVAGPVRRRLFESFWLRGVDIGDPKVLRRLIIDELRGGTAASEPVRLWGMPVTPGGAPISTPAWRLVHQWAVQWRELDRQIVPLLRVDGGQPVFGVDAVEWLGDEVAARGVSLDLPPEPAEEPLDGRDLPTQHWISANGGRWLARSQRLAELRARVAREVAAARQ
jgi:hypothetical protein